MVTMFVFDSKRFTYRTEQKYTKARLFTTFFKKYYKTNISF